ncbi:MAG: hypothetical protein QOE31_669 [Solirubrobacteraceae bacterium]|nr:hypothetical protein [Solirubrobacteraceae bacterium]
MRLLAVGIGLAVMTTGCGGPDAKQALRDTSRNLAKIHSGDLTMRMILRPADGTGVGFRLQGPFSLKQRMRLPIARIRYTQILGKRSVPATLTSTGRSAFVSVGGATYRLPAGQADALRIVSRGARGLDGLQLDIGRWMRDPKSSGGPDVGGDETDRITGKVRVGPALHDVLDAARKAGAGQVPSVKDIGRLDDAVADSSVELLTGRKDRLLRRLRLRIDLDVPERRRKRLGTAARLRLDFQLGVSRPNRRVRVHAPPRSQPLP